MYSFRKNLYIWCLQTRQLVKVLDAHFGRIIQLEALTIGNWNCAITSSIDRSVKIWNINNIFEQVHVIDRHELQIDHIRYINGFKINCMLMLPFPFYEKSFRQWFGSYRD